MGVAASVPRNAALRLFQLGAAVEGRTKGVKSAASKTFGASSRLTLSMDDRVVRAMEGKGR